MHTMTKREAVELLGISKETFDSAIPQGWLEAVEKKTGVYAPHCFVWLYDKKGGLFGRPFPLTRQGEELLKAMEGNPYYSRMIAQGKDKRASELAAKWEEED